MDLDTIFPALPDGETIIGKYQHTIYKSFTRTIVYVTRFRLLISQKARGCCGCGDRSTYTSIALDSIDQVYEEPTRMSIFFIVLSSIALFIWTTLLIIGATISIHPLTIIGSVCLALSLLAVIGIFWSQRSLRIVISGTFGNAWFMLGKNDARELEAQIIENSYQAQSSFWNQSSGNNLQQHQSLSPPRPPSLGPLVARFPSTIAATPSIKKGPAETLTVKTVVSDDGFWSILMYLCKIG